MADTRRPPYPCLEGVGGESVSSPPAAGQHICQRLCAAPVSHAVKTEPATQGSGACCYRESSIASKNQMSWLVAGRAYVIKLSHDKEPRSGVRAKNYSFALEKCRIKRILLSHLNLSSNFSLPPPYTNPHSPVPSPTYLLNLEFETTHPRMPETVRSSQDPIQLSICLLLSLSEMSQFGQ